DRLRTECTAWLLHFCERPTRPAPRNRVTAYTGGGVFAGSCLPIFPFHLSYSSAPHGTAPYSTSFPVNSQARTWSVTAFSRASLIVSRYTADICGTSWPMMKSTAGWSFDSSATVLNVCLKV